jgi:hypothetical protein
MKTLEDCDLQTRKELVNRVVSSSVICKSARLRDLFLYLCNRVLDESVDDIHELELGHKVFGRPEHYDTAADNIVRVHASLLRKRLAEHFQTEGIDEPITIEIPRGNYAPTFRKRDPLRAVAELPERREPLVLQPDLTATYQHPTSYRKVSVETVGRQLSGAGVRGLVCFLFSSESRSKAPWVEAIFDQRYRGSTVLVGNFSAGCIRPGGTG